MSAIQRRQAKGQVKDSSGLMVANDSTDALLSLNYTLFMKDVLRDAEQLADEQGSSEILPSHIITARNKLLKKFRG